MLSSPKTAINSSPAVTREIAIATPTEMPSVYIFEKARIETNENAIADNVPKRVLLLKILGLHFFIDDPITPANPSPIDVQRTAIPNEKM